MSAAHTVGTAPVKSEFRLFAESKSVPDDDVAEASTSRRNGHAPRDALQRESNSVRSHKGLSKQAKKAQRGQNKNRRFGKVRDELELCWKIASGTACEDGLECRYTHDIHAYLAAKPRDIAFNPFTEIAVTPPFVQHLDKHDTTNDIGLPSLDFTTTCPVFAEKGECKSGLKCRFLGGHAQKDEKGDVILLKDEDKRARTAISCSEVNFTTPETLRQLRARKYPHPKSDLFLRELELAGEDWRPSTLKLCNNGDPFTSQPDPKLDVHATNISTEAAAIIAKRTASVASQTETQDTPIRSVEKKRLNWAGKMYLAPLTTVGNLPFRRLCVTFGADITCGEMGLATSFLSGSREEWSLVRRHSSETTFGIQLAGNKPVTLVPTAEIITSECAGNLDFVDLNCGCPIDLVFKTGSGSALLDAAGRLGKIVAGMNRALGEIPVTVKLRTGVKDGRNNAHKLMPRLSAEWGVGCISLHGRTRQQRYTKSADWDYIKQCVDAVRAREAEEDLPRVPIFGGGDCFSSEDYWSKVETSGVDGVMIGRGALIKPWIFTEVKERREWDISSRERLEAIRKYAEFGLSHFGSDTTGVNTTRRYLCEALSFQHRYIPIGLLERLPGRINDRAPAFRGRDELETLLASADSQDWVKISEMFLGPAPESWTFIPKHKSNAYESQG